MLVPVNHDHMLHLVQQLASGPSQHRLHFTDGENEGQRWGVPCLTSHSNYLLSQDSNPGLCGAWIDFSMERVGDGEHGGAVEGAPGREGGMGGVPPLSSTSLCASVSLSVSLDPPSRSLPVPLSLCLPPLCL